MNFKSSVFSLVFILLTIHVSPLSAYQADSSAVGSIHLSSIVDKTETPLNQPVSLTVSLSWQGRPDKYRISPFDTPNLTNFEITGSSANSRSEMRGGSLFTVKDFLFTLYPIEMGMAYVDEIVISYADTVNALYDNLVTNRIGVKVISPVYEADYGWILHYGLVLLVFAFAAAGTVMFLKKRKVSKTPPEPVQVPLEERTLEDLRKITAGGSGSYKQPLDLLVTLFRRFLTEKFEIPETTRADAAIIKHLRDSGVSQDIIDKAGAVFDSAEQLRFSGADVMQDQFELIRGMAEACVGLCRTGN